MAKFKNIFVLAAVLIIAMSTIVSADSTDNESNVKVLYAGQNIEAGTVNVSNDCQNIYVTYRMAGDWILQETHLEIATSFEDIPVTKAGNPIVGHFTYKNGELPSGTTTDTYVIPINGKNGTLYIAAHADVSSHTLNEGAWAAGSSFPGQNWATYFTYNITNCNGGEIDEEEAGEGEGGEGEAGEGEGGEGEAGEGEIDEEEAGEGEGDEGAEDSDEDNANDGKKSSSSSGPSRMVAVSGAPNPTDDNAYMSITPEEDIQIPVMSTPEPIYDTEEQDNLATIVEKGSNSLWAIIAMLLSGIWIMSGYGLTYP